MAKINATETVKRWTSKVNQRYDLNVKQIQDIIQSTSGDQWEIIAAFFVFGYAQGHKAAEAERR